MEQTDIYKMELGELISISTRINVLRVPGGWLYIINWEFGTSTFVPFNKEFIEPCTVVSENQERCPSC